MSINQIRFTSISSILSSSPTPSAPPRAIQPVPTSRTTMTAYDVSSITTDAQGSAEGGYFFSEWPWWWWIAAAAGGAVLLIFIVGCICCCCCRRRKRNLAGAAAEDGGVEMHVHPPTTGLRRMNSSAAKRYLHNVVSIFSWGSDFELDKDCPIGQNEYANPQAIGLSQDNVAESSLSAPPRPPRKRKSDNIYLNIPRKG